MVAINTSSFPEEAGEVGAQPDLPENPASPGETGLAPTSPGMLPGRAARTCHTP